MKKSTTIIDDPLYLPEGRRDHRQLSYYKKLCDQIDKDGFIPVRDEDGETIKIYSRWIIDIILQEKVRVKKIETGTEELVNGFDYLKDYIKGYHEGVSYFRKEYGISSEAFYKSDKYIPDLQNIYFISKQDDGSNGLESIKNSVYPVVFNHASIRNFGYKSGIVRGVEELKEKYPVSFKDFEKLDNDFETSEFTVKSICIAYLYLYKKGNYPIPEITMKGKKSVFYKRLSETYGLSPNSIKLDWPYMEERNNRIKHPDIIKTAIELLKKFSYSNIAEVLKLAESELREAQLKL